MFCHPSHKLTASLRQSGDIVQAVFVPSITWWEPANADALDGYADWDPDQLAAAPAQVPVVHKQPGVVTGSSQTMQAFNAADQVCHTAVHVCFA